MSAISPEHATFVEEELAALTAYDGTRPHGHPYAFHLHSKRVAKDMRGLALALDMGDDRAEELYTSTLIHDAGKRLLPVEIWDMDGKPDDKVKKMRRRHTELGVDIVNDRFGADDDHPFLILTRDLMAHHHEQMDGKGYMKMAGDQLSREARMLCICDAFDGYSTWRPHFGNRDLTPKGVLYRMDVEKDGQFDKEILDVFARMKNGSV